MHVSFHFRSMKNLKNSTLSYRISVYLKSFQTFQNSKKNRNWFTFSCVSFTISKISQNHIRSKSSRIIFSISSQYRIRWFRSWLHFIRRCRRLIRIQCKLVCNSKVEKRFFQQTFFQLAHQRFLNHQKKCIFFVDEQQTQIENVVWFKTHKIHSIYAFVQFSHRSNFFDFISYKKFENILIKMFSWIHNDFAIFLANDKKKYYCVRFREFCDSIRNTRSIESCENSRFQSTDLK